MYIMYKIYFSGFNYYVDKNARGVYILIQYFNNNAQEVHEECERLKDVYSRKFW